MRRISIVVADRHPVVLWGMSSVLGAASDFNIVASCSDATSCIEASRDLAPDIAMVDPAMPELAAARILSTVNSENRSTQLVFFTASEDCELVLAATPVTCNIISERHRSQGAGAVAAADRQRSQRAAVDPIRSNRVARAGHKFGEWADNADGTRAPDHASGLRGIVE